MKVRQMMKRQAEASAYSEHFYWGLPAQAARLQKALYRRSYRFAPKRVARELMRYAREQGWR